MRERSCSHRLRLLAATIGSALLWSATAPAAWCDFPFREVSRGADTVLLAEYRGAKGAAAALHVIEVLKGEHAHELLSLPVEDLGHEPRPADLYLLALDATHQLIRSLQELGACSPISVVRVRHGKVQANARDDYDGGSRPLTLDQVRAELIPLLRGASGGAEQCHPRLEDHAQGNLREQR
jgi:hypothetical protein